MATKRGFCKHCGRPIFYDRLHRMWSACDGIRTFFYSPKDPNAEQGQHIPREEASDGR